MLSNAHPRPWRRDSIFGPGRRVPLDRERRAVWKARLELFRRAGRITADHALVGLALVKRLAVDGRCDPSHATLANDSGTSVSTVQRALVKFAACGLAEWARRLVRDGWRTEQTSNAYVLTLGEPPEIRAPRCAGQCDRGTLEEAISPLQQPALEASQRVRCADLAALARVAAQRLAAINAGLLRRGMAT
jgi:DNA-binding transcriptional MocR family regulator